MVQREGLHCHELVRKNHLGRLRLDGREIYGYAELLPEIGEKKLQHGAERVRTEYPDACPAGREPYGRKQPEEAEDVVAVDVGYENRIDALERKMLTAELTLCAFPAVNQKQAPTYIQYLSA